MMTRSRSPRPLAILTLALVVPFAALGCEDEEAQRRAEIQEIVAKASADLQTATIVAPEPGDDDFEDTRSRLQRVSRELGQVRDGAEGQQAAAALLGAVAERELASMTLAQVRAVEQQHRLRRQEAHAEIDAALRLDGLASRLSSMSTNEARATLAEERAIAERRVRDFSAQLGNLDGPISDREQSNLRDNNEATRLKKEAMTLHRQAQEAGPAAGLGYFNEHIARTREADQFEYQVAQREIDLEYDLRPERTLASTHIAHLTALLDQIGEAERSLASAENLARNESRQTTQVIDAFRSDLAAHISALADASDGELGTLYEEAYRLLDEAKTRAERAVQKSRGDADAARVALARVHDQIAQAAWLEARGHAGDVGVLQRVVDAGGALGSSDARAALEKSKDALAAATKKATAALEAAKEAIGQVNSRESQSEVAAFRAAIDASLAAMSGAAMPAGGTAAPAGGGMTAPAGKMTSPDDIVALMKSISVDNMDAARRLLEITTTRSPAARRVFAAQRKSLPAVSAFLDAIRAKFPAEAGPMMQMMGAQLGVGGYESAEIVERSGDEATGRTMLQTMAGPQEQTFTMRKVGDEWVLDGDSMFASASPEELAMGADASEKMVAVFETLAQRIMDDEFASLQDMSQAMQQAMMEAMMPAGG